MTNENLAKITLNNYQELLRKIKASIDEAGQNIAKVATREKVVMAHKIGQLIEENLQGNDRATYGKKLFKQLEQDISINERTLYRMHNFYKSYPDLPKDEGKLNWSHYSNLAEISNQDQRDYLESLAIESSWSADDLINEVRKIKKTQKDEIKNEQESPDKKEKAKTRIQAIRGQLFTYPLITFSNSNQKFVDLGFEIFEKIDTKIETGQAVVSVKNEDDSYQFKTIEIHGRKLNIYKAYLERVVDGDTIRVILDLGFNIFHREILRLRAINAAELETKEGQESSEFLKELLKDVPFLIVKTVQTDIYGRYVCDVFLPCLENANKTSKKLVFDANLDAQEVANNGIYLNQFLVDENTVELA